MKLSSILLTSTCSLALIAGPAMAQQVGVTAAVNQSASGTPPAAATRTLSLGDNIIHDELIETGGEGLLQILLADGTTFTVGPNSSMTIDSFVYEPDSGTAELVASLGRGVFRFIGGKASKRDGGVTLDTPLGTAGIRGGMADFNFPPLPARQSIHLLFGLQITLDGVGGRRLLYQPGYSLTQQGGAAPQVQKTTPEMTQEVQTALEGQPQRDGGSSIAKQNLREKSQQPATPGAPPSGPGQSSVIAAILQSTLPPGPEKPSPPPGPPPGPTYPDGIITWGDIAASSLAGASATYTGLATGTLITLGVPTAETGDFELTYDFGANVGDVSITNFGPHNIVGNGEVGPTVFPPSGNATFEADFNWGAFSSAEIDGVFRNSNNLPANEVIGTFEFEDSSGGAGFSGSGTFSGER